MTADTRIIKFRGQRVDNKEMFYGSLLCNINGIPNEIWSYNDGHIGYKKVISKTVGQLLFTTISDLELFDGDIFDIGQTVNGQSQFVITAGKYGIEIFYNHDRNRPYEYSIPDLLKDEMDEIKIIGNIHSNQNL